MFLSGLGAVPAASQDVPRPVKLMVVERGDNVLRRQFFGKVVARQTVDLALQVSGQLLEFPVIEGALVSEGSLIAQLDLEPFQRALDTAIVQRDQAERVLNRLQQLSSSTASQASIDDAQSAFDLAAIAVRDAEFALNNATLEAPFDGLVAARNVANFTTVQAGAPIVRLHDVGEWRVEIDVPEVLFRTVGESPDFTIYATFTGSDRQIPLDLREFNAEASAIGQTFNITLAMLEEPGPGVLPGTSVTVVADRQVNETAVEIPASAIQIADDGSQAVLVFEPDGSGDMGTIRRQPVTFEASADGEFLLGDELEDGTEIVVAGVNRLEDGQQVRRFTGFSN